MPITPWVTGTQVNGKRQRRKFGPRNQEACNQSYHLGVI